MGWYGLLIIELYHDCSAPSGLTLGNWARRTQQRALPHSRGRDKETIERGTDI